MGKKEDEKIAPHCDFMFVHEEVVKQVMEVMPQGKSFRISQSFSGFSGTLPGFASSMP